MDKKSAHLTDEQLKRITQFAWKEHNQGAHLSSLEIATYVEMVNHDGEIAAVRSYPGAATHLTECDICLAESLIVERALMDRSPDPSFKPDLSFLSTRQVNWEPLEQHVWKLVKRISVKIDQARLSLVEGLQIVQLVPVAAHATRGQVAGTQSGTVEMVIDLPDRVRRIKILLLATTDGHVQCLLLGILDSSSGSALLEGVQSQLIEATNGFVHRPIQKKGLGLDFGLMQPGEYILVIEYDEEQVRIPLHLNAV